MNSINATGLVVLIAALSAASQTSQVNASDTRMRWISDTEMEWLGSVSQSSVIEFKALLAGEVNTLRTLYVTSGGGNARSAIELGEILKEQEVKLVVRGVCLSSCANYLVAGAPAVVVEADGVIGWHGGALQTNWAMPEPISNDDMQNMRASFSEWCEAEKTFFEQLPGRRAVTILGQLPHHVDTIDSVAWTFSLSDLKRFGWKHISAEDGELASTNPQYGITLSRLTPTKEDYMYRGNCDNSLNHLHFE